MHMHLYSSFPSLSESIYGWIADHKVVIAFPPHIMCIDIHFLQWTKTGIQAQKHVHI